MSDLYEIKNKLLNEDRLKDIYEAMGCTSISFNGGRIEAQLPPQFHSNNKRSVQTKLTPSLSSSIRTPVGFHGGDIFSLVSFLVHDKRNEDEYRDDLFKAKQFICETLGWLEFLKGGEYKTKKDYVAPLKALIKGERKKREVIPNPVLSEEIMNQFYIKGRPVPFSKWIEEGISYSTQEAYGVGFCLESHRVVFPLRNRLGQIVGVKGRIMKDEDDPKKKYMYIYRCNNRYEWFNFHLAVDYILKEKRVYILESEKSVMKLFQNHVHNCLAIGASDMSFEQADILKSLGLDIEIVLCYDKGISIDDINKQAELYRGRKVSYMYDFDNLLSGKDAPIDKGIEIWNNLTKNYVFEINFEEIDRND